MPIIFVVTISAGAPAIIGMPAQHYVTEGVLGTFPCYVSGQPTPLVHWYLNNRYIMCTIKYLYFTKHMVKVMGCCI